MSWSGGVRSQLKMENRKSKISAAEGVGFEPTRACALPVFKTGAINHSTTPPVCVDFAGIVPLSGGRARGKEFRGAGHSINVAAELHLFRHRPAERPIHLAPSPGGSSA